MIDICAVLNLHREGLLAHSSLLSMLEAKAVAEGAGIRVDVLVVADRPDEATRSYLETAQKLGARVLETDVADLGMARNAAVAASESRFLAFLDGDDLWTGNWLRAAYEAATRDGREAVWHPEASLYFGSDCDPYWVIHPDLEDHPHAWMRLGLCNLWTALAFAPRALFARVPYRRIDLRAGFGYEDWHWNCETVAAGAVHKTVPGTAHLIRVSSTSLIRQTGAARALVMPSRLFRERLVARERLDGAAGQRERP